MKKLICFILLFYVYSSCFTQNNIKGIGIFKIGETKIDIIDKMLKDYNTKLENYNDREEVYWFQFRVDNMVAELFPNISDSNISPLRTCFCPDVRVFYINKYEIVGIHLTSIHLRFYKNLLIEFSCDSNEELRQALTTKYGNPLIMENWKKIWDNNKNDSISYSSLIWNNKPIYASITFENKSVKHDSNFIIRDTNYDEIIQGCEIHKKEKYLNMESKRLKENEDKKNKELLDKL